MTITIKSATDVQGMRIALNVPVQKRVQQLEAKLTGSLPPPS